MIDSLTVSKLEEVNKYLKAAQKVTMLAENMLYDIIDRDEGLSGQYHYEVFSRINEYDSSVYFGFDDLTTLIDSVIENPEVFE